MGAGLSYPVASKYMKFAGNDVMRIASGEMQGYRVNMEDALSIRLSLSEKHRDLSYFGVFDGHSGDAASIFTSQTLHQRLGDAEDPTDPETIKAIVQSVDKEFVDKPDVRTNGSTAVFAMLRPAPDDRDKYQITVGHVGDSRAVLIRANGTHQALTKDHKPENPEERERIVAAGGSVQMNRVDGELAMSRAMGYWNYKCNPNIVPHLQKVISVPDVTSVVASKGDILLIACDGIFEAVETPEVANFVHQEAQENSTDPAHVVSALLDFSLKHGSKDNMTAIVIYLTDGRDYGREDLFVAGPYDGGKTDQQFVDAYKADAARHGVSPERLMELAKEADAHDSLGLPAVSSGGGDGMHRINLSDLIAQAIASVESNSPYGPEDGDK